MQTATHGHLARPNSPRGCSKYRRGVFTHAVTEQTREFNFTIGVRSSQTSYRMIRITLEWSSPPGVQASQDPNTGCAIARSSRTTLETMHFTSPGSSDQDCCSRLNGMRAVYFAQKAAERRDPYFPGAWMVDMSPIK